MESISNTIVWFYVAYGTYAAIVFSLTTESAIYFFSSDCLRNRLPHVILPVQSSAQMYSAAVVGQGHRAA